MVAAAVIGGAVIGGVATSMAGSEQADAAESAANTQAASADKGVAEQRRQFDLTQNLLRPYVNTGTSALEFQKNFAGLNGPEQLQGAIDSVLNSPMFSSSLKQGENAILQNASATGGLRGGNTQSALAQFRPQLLSSLIDQQYQRLGGLTTLGQNSAVMQANLGQQTAGNISNLFQQAGAAQAGSQIAAGNAAANSTRAWGNAGQQIIGYYAGGGF